MGRHIKYTLLSNNLPYYVAIDNDRVNHLFGKIQMEDWDTSRPIWSTPSGNLATISEGESITPITLNATKGATGYGELSYYVLTDKDFLLPIGLQLRTDGTIEGYIQETPFRSDIPIGFKNSELPVWNTSSGNLGVLREKEVFDKTVSASLGSESSALNLFYYIANGYLPFGFTLDTNTGRIYGVPFDIVSAQDEFVDLELSNKPRWNTLGGRIANLGEREVFSTTITVNHPLPVNYYIISGKLPFGLTLQLDGTISGTTGEEINPNDIVEYGDDIYRPIINTTDIGSFNIGDSVSVTLSATGQSGRAITDYYIYGLNNSSELPIGLTLNHSTGDITGTISPMNKSGLYSIQLYVADNTGSYTTKSITYRIN